MTTYVLIGASESERYELEPGRSYIVGRAVTSDIPIYDPTISRRHAELTPLPTGVRVRDLGSSNGTFINGTSIETGQLAEDDSVTFGKVACQLRAVASAEFPQPVEAKSQVPGGTIIRQVSVSAAGKIPLAEVSQEELQSRRLALLLDVSQTLAGEFDPDKLLTQVVDTTFAKCSTDETAAGRRHY